MDIEAAFTHPVPIQNIVFEEMNWCEYMRRIDLRLNKKQEKLQVNYLCMFS